MTTISKWRIERSETVANLVTWHTVERCENAWDSLDALHANRRTDPFGVFRIVLAVSTQ